MTLLSVPIIDIAPYWTGGDAGKRAVAAAVDRACRDIGFLIISGHGIPGEMVEETRVLARAFFELPLAEKMRVGQPAPNVSRGYTARKRGGGALARCGGGRGRSERILHGGAGAPCRSDLRHRRHGGTAFCRQSVAG